MHVTGYCVSRSTLRHVLFEVLQMLLVFSHNGQYALGTAKARLRFPCRKRPQFRHWLVILGDDHFLTRTKFADQVRQGRLGFFYADGG